MKNKIVELGEDLKIVLLGFFAMFTWISILRLMGFEFHNNKLTFAYFIIGGILAPLWEELTYRYVPIKIGEILNRDLLWPIIILSCVLFGWGHGNGVFSLLIQGVFGLIQCLVFMRTKYSYLSSVVLHMMWNLFCTQYSFGL